MRNRQLEHWRGAFGDAYNDRNPADGKRLQQATATWSLLLSKLDEPPRSILEVGANVGANLRAIRSLSDADLWGLEPNALARERLLEVLPRHRILDAVAQSIPMEADCVDLAFTRAVLIHVHPDDLLAACNEIYRCARKYIICIEYFSDEPEVKRYRGHDELLFKRDYGGFYLDNFPDLVAVDCGFQWRRMFGANETWWILAKSRD